MSIPLGIQICEGLLNLQGYSASLIEVADYKSQKQIHVYIDSTRPIQCPIYKQALPIYDTRLRYIQHASILCKPVVLVLHQVRTNCPSCGVKTEPQTIARGKNRHSILLEKLVLLLSSKLDNNTISELLGFSPSSIYRIDKEGLQQLEPLMSSCVPKPEHISIDEMAHKRRHNYTTVMTNQEDAKVIDIHPGKSKNSAMTLFSRWGHKFNWLQTISMDFSQSYISAAVETFNEHYIVFDRFHFSRIVNRSLEKIRREIQQHLPDGLRKQSKKHSRWLVLRRSHNSNSHQLSNLEQLKVDNQELFEAYLLKEDLLSIFDEDIKKEEAESRLLAWCTCVEGTNYKPFQKLAIQIRKRLSILLNWFEYHISNAKAEAVNNVIKALLRRAFGYKDYEYFRLKVLQKCGYLMYAFTHSL